DFGFGDELHDLNCSCELNISALEIFVCNLYVVVFLVLVSTSDFLPGHFLIFSVAEALVGNRTEVPFVEVMERDFFSLGRTEQRNRNCDECKTDVTLPYGSHRRPL